MKRILTFFISFALALSCFSLPAFAENTKNLLFEVSVDGKNQIVVNAGDRITVDFTVENITDDDGYSISNLQNEIEFDDDFFEFTEGDVELVTAYFSRYADDYSWGAKRVQILARHIDGGKPKAYQDRQLVARVTFKVKDGLAEGTSGKLENKVCEAAEAMSGVTYTTSSKSMTVYIGNAPAEKHTLTYKNGDAVVNTDDNAAAGSTVKIYSGLTAADNRFAGWRDAAGNLLQPGEDYTVTQDMTFTAVWLSKYTLAFDTNGGGAIADRVAWQGEEISLTDYTPARSGYTFKGWYTESGLTNRVTSLTLAGDTTVYAKWEANGGGSTGGGSSVARYTLSFQANGGSAVNPVSKVRNTTVNLSKYITKRDGYSFDGWHTDKELTQKVTEIKMTKDTTLYAKWVEGEGGYTAQPNYRPDIMTDEHYAYIVGRDGGYIYPDMKLTRAEAATIFFRLLNPEVRSEGMTKQNTFADVNDGDWFNTAISTLANLEVLNGRSADSFAPNEPITRAEFTTIVARLSEASYAGGDLFSDISGHWGREYINIAASINWVNGENGMFRPDDNITRAEVVTLVNRALNRLPEGKDDLLENMFTAPDNTDTTAWYYLAVQEATNSHTYETKADGKHEKWTALTQSPNWAELEN